MRVFLASAIVGLLPATAVAQSAQPFGVQVALLATAIESNGARAGGLGVEPQIRFNRIPTPEAFGGVSIGIGGQFTSHQRGRDNLRITGVFLEPRWVPPLPSSRLFPYLSARLAILRVRGDFVFAADGSSSGSGLGGGGGVVVKLTRTINIDVGAQFVRQQFDPIGALVFRPSNTYAAKAGVSLGLPR
jgi:hypothetical protein